MVLLSSLVLTACNSGGGSSGGSTTASLTGTYNETTKTLVQPSDAGCPSGQTVNNIMINSNNQYCGINNAYCYTNPINLNTPQTCFSGQRIAGVDIWNLSFNNCTYNNNQFSYTENLQYSNDSGRSYITCNYNIVMTKQ